jgi:hypothetical protein
MRMLQFNMLGSVATQYVESDEEAARLYGAASQALSGYRPLFRNEGDETWELVVSDGSRQTFRLDKLASVTLTEPALPDWLREFYVESKRRALQIEAAAASAAGAPG